MAFPLCQVSLCVSPVIHLSVVERPRDGMPGQFCVVHTLAPHSFYTNNFSPLPPSTFSSVQWEDGGAFVQVVGIQKDKSTGRQGASMYTVFSSLCPPSVVLWSFYVCAKLSLPLDREFFEDGVFIWCLSPSSEHSTLPPAKWAFSACLFVCFYWIHGFV